MPRIIPADAGSTPIGGRPPHRSRDHPRGCGEHAHLETRIQGHGGSSPRMRGAHSDSKNEDSDGRIIPADAGSTVIERGCALVLQDHPRGCGEHVWLIRMTCD